MRSAWLARRNCLVPFSRLWYCGHSTGLFFSTPNTESNTTVTSDALQSLYPKVGIEVRDLPLHDPTDYVAILTGFGSHIREITDSTSIANYFIAVASGTPQMHAC